MNSGLFFIRCQNHKKKTKVDYRNYGLAIGFSTAVMVKNVIENMKNILKNNPIGK